MKLTAAELKRLMELMAKSADKLSDAEKSELNTLKAKADASQDGDKELTSDDLKALIESTVKAAVGNQLTEAQVKTLVTDAVKGLKPEGLDTAALVENVKKAIPVGITEDAVKAIVENAVKSIHKPSKMQFEEGSDIEFPIAHRTGNLPVDAKQLLNIMTGKPENDGIPESVLKDATTRGERAEKRILQSMRNGGAYGTKAITTSGAGTGAEFMNVVMSSTLLSRMYMDSILSSAFIGQEVQMPSDNFTYPLSTTRPTFYTGAENTDADESTPGTGELILTARKLIGKVSYSYEADEDSIVAILPQVLQGLGEAAGEALEDAIINGDRAGTHQDSDTQLVAKHAARLFNGIRKLTLAQSALKLSLATGGITANNVGALRKLLKKYGLNPRNVKIIVGTNGWNDIVMLPETLTAEKVGNAGTARILTGLAPNLLGMDIIPSAKVREDLNANGVYDGTTTTKGAIHLVHLPSFVMGVRRGFLVEQDKDISAQKRWVVASFRRDFQPIEPLSTITAAATGFGYNS